MWIISKHGFFSITRSPMERHLFQVRAREKNDLKSLLAGVCELPGVRGIPAVKVCWEGKKILTTEHTDYRFRVIVDANELSDVMEALQATVDYTNFKSAMGQTPTQKHKVSALHHIWEIMERFQPRRMSRHEAQFFDVPLEELRAKHDSRKIGSKP